MAILSTTINGTHVNSIEAEVNFKTTISDKILTVHITILRDGQNANQSDNTLSPEQLTDTVAITGDGGIKLSGVLTFDLKSRSVVFDGNLNYQDHVRLGMGPVIVAAL